MKLLARKSLIFVILFVVVFSIVMGVNAQRESDGGGREHEGGFAGALGGFAVALLWVGAIYVVAAMINNYLKKLADKGPSQYPEVDEAVIVYRNLWKEFRSRLLVLHNVAMLAACIVGLIHGILLLNRTSTGLLVTGAIAEGIMVLLSVFGAILFYRLRPIWDYRGTRKFTKFVHRQWVMSALLIIFLLLHVGLRRD